MPSTIEVDHSDNGRTITLGADQTLVVRLPENPTTGYRWTVETAVGLKLVADNFSPAGTGIGSDGVRRFEWSAAPGTYELALTRRRQWEGAGQDAGRFRLTVVVAMTGQRPGR